MAMTREDNDLLCRVEHGAPMGEMIRQHYWIPAIPSSKLEPGGRPYRVRLLGTELVAFRSPDGTVGIVDERCPHRRASLALGRNEPGGLRCIYHAWKIAPDGGEAQQAEAERERRAKIIAAEGELQASQKLSEAAQVMEQSPVTIQLRYLQTLREMSAEKATHTIIPFPMDLFKAFLKN